MQDFTCINCGQRLTFENSVCLGCQSEIGFDPDSGLITTINPTVSDDPLMIKASATDKKFKRCANATIAQCNWLLPDDSPEELCVSCALTNTRPNDKNAEALAEFAKAEAAKRRMVAELLALKLPVMSKKQADWGVAFDLLEEQDEKVFTGHADGLITLNLVEADEVEREKIRTSMAEPYRTLLGHFRHEVGHYYYMVLVGDEDLANFKELFGDPDASYQDALDRHYEQGPPEGWEDDYVSAYATMHAAEDWAETFAHYLHIRDTLDTAAAFGLAPSGATLDKQLIGTPGFNLIIDTWLPLAWSLNMINRSMGQRDLYPFVLSPTVLEKMAFVHYLILKKAEEQVNA